MRILTGATRALLTVVTTVHIAAIRVAAWAERRKIAAAQAATDAAGFAANVARAAAKEADVLYQDAVRAESRVVLAVANVVHDLQSEVDGLRRGVSL